jgi:hypothetical protein
MCVARAVICCKLKSVIKCDIAQMDRGYSCRRVIMEAARSSGKGKTRGQISAFIAANYDTKALGLDYAKTGACRRTINATLKHAVTVGDVSFKGGFYKTTNRKVKVPAVCVKCFFWQFVVPETHRIYVCAVIVPGVKQAEETTFAQVQAQTCEKDKSRRCESHQN